MQQHTFSNFIYSKTFSFCCPNNSYENPKQFCLVSAFSSIVNKSIVSQKWLTEFIYELYSQSLSSCLLSGPDRFSQSFDSCSLFHVSSPLCIFALMSRVRRMKTNWETTDLDCSPEKWGLPGNEIEIVETDRASSLSLSLSPVFCSYRLLVPWRVKADQLFVLERFF